MSKYLEDRVAELENYVTNLAKTTGSPRTYRCIEDRIADLEQQTVVLIQIVRGGLDREEIEVKQAIADVQRKKKRIYVKRAASRIPVKRRGTVQRRKRR